MLAVTVDGKRVQFRAPLVTIANAPYCGAAYTMAQDAHIDDGQPAGSPAGCCSMDC
jgi:hypothetical protein